MVDFKGTGSVDNAGAVLLAVLNVPDVLSSFTA